MKHFYLFFSRTLLLAAALLFLRPIHAQVQGVTTVTMGSNCTNVVANFNTSDDAFNSPSLYYGNSPFYFNSSQGWWSEVDGISSVPPIPGGGGMRLVSIISPLYNNPNPVGTFDVGFYYVVPDPSVNRFQIRIISATPQGPYTVYNVEATTGFRPFSTYSVSAPTAYTGGASQITGMQGIVCVHLIDADITNAPGVAYRVEITYEVAEPQFTVFDNLSIGGVVAGPLPVTFMGMAANKVDNGVEVKWDVADEINVKEYQLEKSTNAVSFATVGTIPANGRTSVYSITDPNIKAAEIFYRVKSVDVDGKVKYSGILRYRNATSYSNSIKLYPSPVRSQLTVQHKQLGAQAKIIISTIDGKALKQIKPGAGISNTMIDVGNLSAGMYILQLDDGKGKIETSTFVKQ